MYLGTETWYYQCDLYAPAGKIVHQVFYNPIDPDIWIVAIEWGEVPGFARFGFIYSNDDFDPFAFCSEPVRRIVIHYRYHGFAIPYYSVFVIATFIPGAGKIRRAIKWLRRRRYPGLCGNCGYDLRASHSVCSECGVDIPEIK